ncbi:hypothetical protein RFI_36072 [Reticulomyxa filosa]|uniref:Uncharacterized protein n=1 Tax=Reticulomyxa filosa TaxID=46433 RepID=X6LHG9_RETFI|nr:hypothetical protein RFI_36072 [Reticulomyxa filosa]|eukprot:ETO01368.1 hypothetical protein RFI_36072 [Reticulomyxa filosa]
MHNNLSFTQQNKCNNVLCDVQINIINVYIQSMQMSSLLLIQAICGPSRRYSLIDPTSAPFFTYLSITTYFIHQLIYLLVLFVHFAYACPITNYLQYQHSQKTTRHTRTIKQDHEEEHTSTTFLVCLYYCNVFARIYSKKSYQTQTYLFTLTFWILKRSCFFKNFHWP